jgi:signal transduction histidine kinase
MISILMIEDEDAIREEVMDWLQFEGFKVFGARNGRLGLEAAKAHKPDLIICDINMPEMDGFQVLYELRTDAELHLTPFIFLTASDNRESFRTGMDLGADDYLTKPFTHSEVINAVRSRLQKHIEQQEAVQNQLKFLDRAFEEEREKRLLKSRLVAMFSHDFRNPLAVIMSSATLMRNYEDRINAAQRGEKLNRIISSVKQLIQMLDDMLVVAEMESGHFDASAETIDLSQFIAGIMDEFRAEHEENYQFRFDGNGGIRGDISPRLLRQIVVNLVSNAVRYSPPKSEIIVMLSQNKEATELVVQDFGIGIPEEDRPHLFEPFSRGSNAKHIKGTGLGLAIVKEAVELCRGEIGVESKLGEGTSFVIRFPRS